VPTTSRLITGNLPNRLPTTMIRWVLLSLLLVTGCARPAAERCCQSAETALREGRLDTVLPIVDDCARQYPDAPEPRRMRVIVLLRLDRLEEAKTAVSALPADDPILRTALRRRDSAVRVGAARLLAEKPTGPSFRALVRGLQDPVVDVRRYCTRALGKLRNPAALKPLYRALQDDNWHVRAEAVDALREIGDPRCVGWLIARLKDGDGYVRYRVMVALETLASEASREFLLKALDRTGEAQRLGIAFALARLHDPAALGPLTNALQHTDQAIRRWAVQALATGGWPAATNSLAALVEDSDAEVRALARATLDKLRQRPTD